MCAVAVATETRGSWWQLHRCSDRMGSFRPRKRAGRGSSVTPTPAAGAGNGVENSNSTNNVDDSDSHVPTTVTEGDVAALAPSTTGPGKNKQRRQRSRRGRKSRAENGNGPEVEEKEEEDERENEVTVDTMEETPRNSRNPTWNPPGPLPGRRPRRPNYFISARMKLSPDATETVEKIHAKLAELTPELTTAAVTSSSAHVTLAVFHLADQYEVDVAAAALRTLAETPEMATGGPVRATLENLGHFRHQVLYVGMRDDDERCRLATLAKMARRAMVDAGVMEDDEQHYENDKDKDNDEDNDDDDESGGAGNGGGVGGGGGAGTFTPHVTVAKTSKVRWKKSNDISRNSRLPRGDDGDVEEDCDGKENRGGGGADVVIEDEEDGDVVVAVDRPVNGGDDGDVEEETTNEENVGVYADDNVDEEDKTTETETSPEGALVAVKAKQKQQKKKQKQTQKKKRNMKRRKAKLPTAELMDAFPDVRLGTVEVTRLELCSMMGPKDEEGYYQVCAAAAFSSPATAMMADDVVGSVVVDDDDDADDDDDDAMDVSNECVHDVF